MNLALIIREVQTALGVEVDGAAGPQTWQAIRANILGTAAAGEPVPTPAAGSNLVDARSERAIDSLLPEVRTYARALLHAADAQGITLIVTSATRSYAEQDALYQQGRTRAGKVVTNARAGHSNHNFGVAFDVTIFRNGEPVWESPAYKAVGALGKSLGLTWGGDWISIDDQPHFELHPAWARDLSEEAMLAELRRRHDAGAPIFA
jgi:peptidoglycan L-alanyl-D-glutamate endopeptidase CwlK